MNWVAGGKSSIQKYDFAVSKVSFCPIKRKWRPDELLQSKHFVREVFFFFLLQLVKRSGTSSEILEPYTFLMSLMFSFRLHGLYYDVCSVVSTLSHLTTESYVQIFVSILKSWRKLLWEKAYQCSFSQLRMASNIKVQVVR